MRELYPLSLRTSCLDFSYCGKFNLDAQVFLDIPFVGEKIEYGNETNILSICFEMNSLFGSDYLQETGLKIILQSKKIKIENQNIENEFNKKIQESATFSKLFFYTNEADLYLKISTQLSDFLMEYFAEICNKKIKISHESVDDFDYQINKINSFIEMIDEKFNEIMKESRFDDEIIKKYDIVFINSTILNPIVPSDDFGGDILIELLKISKKNQYHKLNKELTTTTTTKSIIKKI